MKIELINIDELKPFERNPKVHPEKQIQKIIKSIQEFGFTNPILALKENNMVIAGHARLKAAKRLNVSEVPVILLDMPYEKAIAYVVADNRLAELAKWDDIVLQKLFQEMSSENFALTGFEISDIKLDVDNKKTYSLDDFLFEDVKEPCWFVIRADIGEFEKLKEQVNILHAEGLHIVNSQDAYE